MINRFFSFLITRVGIAIVKLATLYYCAKNFEIANFSLFLIVLSLTEIGKAIIDFGGENYIYSKLGPKNKKLKIATLYALRLRLNLAFFVTILIASLILFNAWPIEFLIIIFIVPGYLIYSTSFVLMQKEEQFNLILIATCISLILSMICLFFIFSNSDFLLAAPLSLIAVEINLAIVFGILMNKNYVNLIKGLRIFKTCKKAFSIYKLTAAIGMTTVVVIFYSRLDIVVRPIIGDLAQGYLSLALRYVEPINQLFSILIFTFMVQLGAGQSHSISNWVHRIIRVNILLIALALVLLGCSLGLVGYFLTYEILGLPITIAYCVALLIIAVPFKFINGSITAILYSRDMSNYVFVAALINMFVVVIMSIFLGKVYGVYGVCFAITIGEAVNLCYQRSLITEKKES
jgi:O-antigen/teichoic acid export membrane protein